MHHEHLLIIRFSAMGDVAMTVPVVWALARQYPDLRITVLSRPFAHAFFAELAPNVNFMAADLKKEYHGVKGLNALYRRLTAKQFTAIADLHNVLRSDYLRLRFNLGRYRVEHIDKHRTQRRRLVASEPKKVLAPLPSPFDNYLDVFRRLGYPITPENLCFRSIFEAPSSSLSSSPSSSLSSSPSSSLSSSLSSSPSSGSVDCGSAAVPLAAETKPTGNLNLLPQAIGPKRSWEQWIGLAPFAAHRGKTYPPELTTRLIELLTARYPQARLFLFGRGPQEDDYFARCTQRWQQCLNVGQHTENLYQELILMSHLDVMVSMDSSNMHLASLTDTPVVSIWGATHPYAGFLGWHQNPQNILQADGLGCRPCSIYGQKPCRYGDYRCLTGITPESIVEKITQVLTKNQQAK